ncbi:MAG: serine hydrolase domain-containing protein [Chitinophagaceae bacterium]
MRYKTLCFIIFVYTATFANAQSWQDTVALIDKVLSRYADANPGAQLAINRNGQIIYSSARGMADLEHNVPLTKTSKIEAGSVSKQFTAASILLLEQQGKLSMNDNVRKYVPEVPDYGYTITLQHLMNHTSGLKDWGSIADIAGWPRGSKAYANNDALQIISGNKTSTINREMNSFTAIPITTCLPLL